jgi:hypothetical protein
MNHKWSRALMLVFAVMLIASISVNCGRTLSVSDVNGAPLPGAYVVYHLEGTTYAAVEALTYQATPIEVLRTDGSGRVVIPWSVHAHWPLIQGGPGIAVDLIYAPALHNGLAWIVRGVAVSRPHEFDVSEDLTAVRLDDVSADPARWQGTLMNLSSVLSRLTSQEMRGERAPALLDDLIEAFGNEYRALIARHGETLRPLPEMPEAVRSATDQEKTAWQAMVARDLAERPRWGDEFKRRFATEIDTYRTRK